MIISLDNNEVEMSGIDNVNNFTISMTPEAFQVLSSTMYSDSVSAILRELGTNAVDSVVQAGTPNVPFTIKLPDYLDPTFYIRDYGVGLTPEEVRTIYTSYFTSTKTNSNNAIGCFGLGSKSVFAYTQNFTVITYKDGTEYAFAIFINEKGMPSYAQTYQKNTDEPNGVKIAFPIKSNDFNDFKIKAHNIYYWFTVKPEILGNSVDLTVPPSGFSQKLLSGNNWTLYRGGSYSYQNGVFYVTMGNILYKTTEECPDGNCLLDSNIGDYDITSSREELKYTDKTNKALEKRIKEYNAEKVAIFNAQLDKCETLYEARLLAMANSRFTDDSTNYRGVSLRTTSGYYADFSVKFGDISMYNSKLRYRKGKYTLSSDFVDYINPSINVSFVDGTDVKNIDRRVKLYLENKPNHSVTVLNFVDTESKTASEVKDYFIKTLGIKDTMLIDGETLEVPKRAPSVKTGIKRMKKGQIKKVAHTTGSYTAKTLENFDYDESLEGVYFVGPYSALTWATVRSFADMLNTLEVKHPDFFIVNESFDLGDTELLTPDEFKEKIKEDKKGEKELASIYNFTNKILQLKKFKDVLCDEAKKGIENAMKVERKSVYYSRLVRLFDNEKRPVWLDKYKLIEYINLNYLPSDGEQELRKYLKERN